MKSGLIDLSCSKKDNTVLSIYQFISLRMEAAIVEALHAIRNVSSSDSRSHASLVQNCGNVICIRNYEQSSN